MACIWFTIAATLFVQVTSRPVAPDASGPPRIAQSSPVALRFFTDLPAATQRAAAEQLPVLAYFCSPSSLACVEFERRVLNDPAVAELLRTRVVSLRLDVSSDPAPLERFGLLDVPALLLLGPDGQERDLVIAYAVPHLMAAELRAALDGEDDVVARLRAAIAQRNGYDPGGREKLANALVRRDRLDEALVEFTWCLEVGLQNVPFAAARRDLLLAGFARLADRSPQARQKLLTTRDAWRASLRNADDVNVARNLAALHHALGDDAGNVATFDELPADSRARRVLLDRVLDQLIDARRYADALALLDPQRDFAAQVALFRNGAACVCGRVHNWRGPPLKRTVVERGARLIEALAAERRDDEAVTLATAVLQFDDAPYVMELLVERAARAARRDLAERLTAAAPPKSKPKP